MSLNPERPFLFQSAAECPLGRVTLAGTGVKTSDAIAEPLRHYHAYALVLTTSGLGTYRDELGNTSALHPGDCILVMPKIAHQYGSPAGGRWAEVFLVFAGPVFDLWFERQLLAPAFPITRLDPVAHWSERIRSACDIDPLTAVTRVQAILADLVAIARSRRETSHTRGDRAAFAFLNASRAAIGDGPRPDWNRIAAQLGGSLSGFRKRFARLSGEPPARYHARRVCERAAHMLATGHTLAETAEACGFVDVFHFSRRFKQFIGLPPSQYRRLASNPPDPQ
jgi:AraC-like DNA-binding protein